jgi:hypothetical protein
MRHAAPENFSNFSRPRSNSKMNRAQLRLNEQKEELLLCQA